MAGGSGPDRKVGHHALLRELGRGGMGTVYLAHDDRLDRQVAIKFVSVVGPVAIERFLSEARVTARCKHPNIVDIHAIGDDDGQPYMVLEYVEGESLQARLQRGPLAPAEAVAILVQVARGLAFAHARGVIHRDLKPANILVDAAGHAKIADFGIAKPFGEDGGRDGGTLGAAGPSDLTAASELPGTLQYMAPEQLRRDNPDDRVDLWAFGVTLYQTLSGRLPHDGLTMQEVIADLTDADRELPRLDAERLGAPPALVELTHRCLEKQVALRLGSAAELVPALEAIAATLGDPAAAAAAPATGSARPPSVADPATAPSPFAPTIAAPAAPASTAGRRRRRRRRSAIVAGTAVAAVAAAVIAFTVLRAERPAAEAAEHGAIARAEAMLAELASLDARGATADGDQLLATFLDEERAPRALALAWLARGDRARRGDEVSKDLAVTSYASAYAATDDRAAQQRALTALGELHLDRWAWDWIAGVLPTYDALGDRAAIDPALAAVRDRMHLAMRDAAARAAADATTQRIATAVLVGRPTAVPPVPTHVVDTDGDGVTELVAIEAGALVVRTLPDLQPRPPRPVDGAVEVRCAGRDDRGAYALTVGTTYGNAPRLVAVADGAVVWSDRDFRVRTCRWIDLGAPGGPELFLLSNRTLARVTHGGDGRWTAAVTETASQPWDAIGGDLDGDGRHELLLVLGEWGGFEVRLARPRADGTLEMLDRIRLGVVVALASLGRDAAGRGRVAALKAGIYASRELSRDQPFGLPAGLYVLTVERDRLALVDHVAVTGISTDAGHRVAQRHHPAVSPLQVADLDGDGGRDLIAGVERDFAGTAHLLVLHAEAGGGFSVRTVSGIAPLAVIETDGDAGTELVAAIAGADTAWLLGAGATAVPARSAAPRPTVPRGTAARGEAGIAAAWQRSERLERLGQIDAAVDTLRRAATFAAAPAARIEALRRAAALLTAADRPTGDLLEELATRAATDDATRIAAWLDAIADDVRHVALGRARARIARLRATGPALAGDAATRLAALAAGVGDASYPLFGADGLDDAWRIDDPALFHVVPGSRQLALETLAPGRIAAVPLTAGGSFELALEGEITRMEWAANLHFSIRDARDAEVVGVEIASRGGGHYYTRYHSCFAPNGGGGEWFTALPDADQVLRFRLELGFDPAAGRIRCTVIVGDRPQTVQLAVAPQAGTAWSFAFGATSEAVGTSATARLTSIEVTGARPAPTPPAPLQVAALAIARHRLADAQAALARLSPTERRGWPASRMAVMVLDESDDRPAAITLLRERIDTQVPTWFDVAWLARARDGQFLAVARAAAGQDAAFVLLVAWGSTFGQELDVPRVRAAALRDLEDLPTQADYLGQAVVMLRIFRGEAALAAGRQEDARRVLHEARALVPADAVPNLRALQANAACLLAAEAASRGATDEARTLVLEAFAVGSREYIADTVLRDPWLGPLIDQPGWESIRAAARPLATLPTAPR
jgi:hypothetical protein